MGNKKLRENSVKNYRKKNKKKGGVQNGKTDGSMKEEE